MIGMLQNMGLPVFAFPRKHVVTVVTQKTHTHKHMLGCPKHTPSPPPPQGLTTTVKALAAAGAHTVLTMHLDASISRLTSSGPRDPAIQAFCNRLQKTGIHPNRLPVFSAHQMGSCRMGGDPATSALDPDGQCWQVAGLYCADASVFPTPSGVNPMITVESMAHMIATRLGGRWRGAHGKREGVTLAYEGG